MSIKKQNELTKIDVHNLSEHYVIIALGLFEQGCMGFMISTVTKFVLARWNIACHYKILVPW